MGMDPLTLGLAMGGASLASSLASGVAGASQQRASAAAQAAQANQLRQQAEIQRQAGEVEARALDKQRAQLRREYEQTRGANRVALGAGNVDLSSGSALQVADGNAIAFAEDMGENAYQKALKRWETDNAVKTTRYQANLLDAQASYQRRASRNLLPTIIGAGLSGAGGFMTGYSFGGKLTR